jgi:RNA polymerase sigma-70 factor (ECF subfamily)
VLRRSFTLRENKLLFTSCRALLNWKPYKWEKSFPAVSIFWATKTNDSMGLDELNILSRLLDSHGAALVLYAQQWCDTPEDVTQDAFISLMRQPQLPENAVGWLYRAVRNAAINARRSAHRRVERESSIARQTPNWFQASADDRLDAAAAARAMENLPLEHRETMIARLWGGLSFEEIAELTGSSTSTVHRWYQAGLNALRERLGATCPPKKTTTNKTKSN